MASPQQIIAALPIGKQNAIKVAQIEQIIGNQPSGTNNDTTRNEVAGLIHSHDIPIGSNSHFGYWLIDSDAECQEVVGSLNSIISTYVEKRDAIIRGWQKRKLSKNTQYPWPK